MQCVLFTKPLKGRAVEEIGSTAAELGFDGVDVLVREGHEIEPEAPEAIGPAVRRLRELGLTVPAATTNINDPHGRSVERILAACGDAGVRLTRLASFPYRAGEGYQAGFDRARAHLDGLVRLAERRRADRAPGRACFALAGDARPRRRRPARPDGRRGRPARRGDRFRHGCGLRRAAATTRGRTPRRLRRRTDAACGRHAHALGWLRSFRAQTK